MDSTPKTDNGNRGKFRHQTKDTRFGIYWGVFFGIVIGSPNQKVAATPTIHQEIAASYKHALRTHKQCFDISNLVPSSGAALLAQKKRVLPRRTVKRK